MSEESFGQSLPQFESKRRRTPSKYALHIDELKKPANILLTRNLSSKHTLPLENDEKCQSTPLMCLLPSGKQYCLQVVIKKPLKKSVGNNKELKKQASEVEGKSISSPQIESKSTLLDKFINAYKQLQKGESENKNGEEEQQQNAIETRPLRRESRRKEKDNEEKFVRFYERYNYLIEELAEIEQEIVTI